MLASHTGNRGVEATGQSALASCDHQKMHVFPARTRKQDRRVGTPFIGSAKTGQNLFHTLGVWTCGFGSILGAAEFGRRDHLHGLGDLLGRFDRVDPVF
mgnify:CR=1 FL=1